MRRLALIAALCICGCKDPEQQAAESNALQVKQAVRDGRAALAKKDFDAAVQFFLKATKLSPNDPMPQLLLAQAQRENDNPGAAVMALKHAEELGAKTDPAVGRERAELYRRMGQIAEAVTTLSKLRDANQLTDAELLTLAKLQASTGDSDGAWSTLERVQERKPDDPDGKVTEAAILLVKGDEVLAANLMDRLLKDNPQLTSARVLRAKYFLTNGYPDMAESDLGQIGPEALKAVEVVDMKARVFMAQKRFDEAASVLQPVVEANPRDADLACLLAETKLLGGHADEAQELIEQALAARENFPRALYVRGLAFERQGDDQNALEYYGRALKVDPSFAPVLQRTWRVYLRKNQMNDAMAALEKLVVLKEATPEERIGLATLYADTGTSLDRGRKMVDEMLKKTPDDDQLKALKKRLGREKPKGIQIIRKRH